MPEPLSVKDIFADALDVPAAERDLFVRNACAGRPEMLSAVRELLAAHENMHDVFASDLEATLSEGWLLDSRYRIVRFLGAGGMGEVYEAFDEELQIFVALKVLNTATLDSDAAARLRREIQLARQISHVNVCRVYDQHRTDGPSGPLTFLSMELLNGETIASLLEDGPLPVPQALAIARQICDGLQAAHSRGIVHRDMKPANVMVAPLGEDQWHVTLTDFGIARTATPGDAFETAAGTVTGTPAYIAPEQLQGKPATPASDIYSFGIVLYEMLTGTTPFRGDSAWGIACKRLTEDPEPPLVRKPDLPEYLNDVVLRCLKRDPAERFGTVLELQQALMAGKRDTRRNPRIQWAVAAGLLVIVTALAILFWPGRGRLRRLPAERHLAVLPFEGNAGGQLGPAFNDGLAESVSARLRVLQTTQKGFWAIPFADIRRQSIISPARAHSVFGATLALQGELQREGDLIRERLKLVDANDGQVLRERSFTVPAGQLTQLTDVTLAQITALLGMTLSPDEQRLLREGGHNMPGAYEFYEQGHGYLQAFGAENMDRAAALFERALTVDPNYKDALAGLAQAYASKYYLTKDPATGALAEAACARALSAAPQNAGVYVSRGMLDLAQGRTAAAVTAFEKARSLDPNRSETLVWLARAYDAAGDLLQAEATFQNAINLQPRYWAGFNNLAEFYARHGQYTKAEPLFRAVTELTPDNPLGYANLGGVYMAQNRYKEAIAVLQRASALRPSPNVLTNLGTALSFEGQYREAAAMFRKATEAAPNDYRHWRNLGDALIQGRDRAAALDAYQHCASTAETTLQANKADLQALSIGGVCQAKLGRTAAARQQTAEAQSLAPRNGAVQFRAAIVYAALHDREAAFRALEAALSAGYPRSEIEHEPDLIPLLRDSRFQQWTQINPRR